ncbi:MAG TPA: hypothetical protein VNM45_14960 [Bacillus sp. (in: firmicutes)]|nr:hypothetical protein [Bacillus sp. (in: firmicutes)]
MKTVTKGALAMVLAGSVTFAVTNVLLGDQISKRLTEESALPMSGDQKKADDISQAEKTVKDQTPTTNVKDGQTKPSHDVPAFQEASENRNKIDTAAASTQQDTKKFSKSHTTNLVSTNKTTTTTPAVATRPVTSTKAPAATTAPKPKGTSTANATPTPAAPTRPVTSTKAPPTTTAPKPTETNTTNTTATPAAPTRPATSAKAPATTTAPKPTGTNTASTPTTNRGQQVSQAAKEKAASHQDEKENNGKKM